MNTTQKGAWIGLVGVLFSIALIPFAFLKIYVLRGIPARFVQFLVIGGGILYFIWIILFLRQKQSPVEVEADERDKLIMKRAVLACFVSVWVCLTAVSVIPRWFVGIDGLIPAWVITIMNLGVVFVATLIYSVAVLVQYGRTIKGEVS